MESKRKRPQNVLPIIPQTSNQTMDRKPFTRGLALKSSPSQLQQSSSKSEKTTSITYFPQNTAQEIKGKILDENQQSPALPPQKPTPKSNEETVKFQKQDKQKSKAKAKIATSRTSKRKTNRDVQVSPRTRYSPCGRPMRRVERERLDRLPSNFDTAGIRKIIISPFTQKMLNCEVGKDVTAEDPCKYVLKEDFEDVLDYQGEESEFSSIKNEILSYVGSKILISFIPDETINYEEFYVCLTEQAEKALSGLIGRIKEKREARINNSIFKSIKPWQSHGSEADVEELSIEGSRPLLEVELEAHYPIVGHKHKFQLMLAQNVKLMYSEILLNRLTFSNVVRKQIDVYVQVSSLTTTNGTQTMSSIFRNSHTEYYFDPGVVTNLSQEFKENIKSFHANKMPILDDMLDTNDYLNIYENDYIALVADERYTRVSELSSIKEDVILTDQDVGKAKVISCATWHPAWDGVLATAHSNTALNSYHKNRKPNDVQVMRDTSEVVPVLLWNILEDHVAPKLYLDTPRDITALSFCPSYPQILLGGCSNGQVVVWDLQDKWNVGREEEATVPTEKHFRLQPLTEWMKIVDNKKCVRTTVVSDLRNSHKSATTCIKWFSPFGKVSSSGKIFNAPSVSENKSLQFMTCSLDGSVLFWDLLVRPKRNSFQARPKYFRPNSLTSNFSSFRALNRVFRPIYKTVVCAPGIARQLPLTVLNITNTVYEEVDCKSILHYKPTRMDDGFVVSQFVAGTVEGDFVIATWDGYEANTGEVVNTETCRTVNFSKFHDGPVVAITISPRFSEIILTVGGKIFALWKMDVVGAPILWRKGKRKYTHGAWDIVQLSMFHLVRDDGCIEIWHLRACYGQYEYIKHISGGSLLGIYQSDVRKSTIGITDHKGNFKTYTVRHTAAELTEEDIQSCYKLCQREKENKLSFWKWQERWKLKNAQLLEQKRKQDTKEKEIKLFEEVAKVEPRKTSLSRPKTAISKCGTDQWRSMERKRFSASVWCNRRLNKEELKRQQLPLIEMASDEQVKRCKQTGRLQRAQDLFKDASTMHFPSIFEKKEPPPPDPYSSGDFLITKQVILENYQKTTNIGDNIVRKHKYDVQVSWLEIGKNAEVKMKRRNMTRSNYINRNRNYRDISNDKMNQYEKVAVKGRKYKNEDVQAEYADLISGDVCSAILSALSLEDTELCDLILDLAL